MKRISFKLTAIAAAIFIILAVGTKRNELPVDAKATISSFPKEVIEGSTLEPNDIVVSGTKDTVKSVSLVSANSELNTVTILAKMLKKDGRNGSDVIVKTGFYNIHEFLDLFDENATYNCSYTFTDDHYDALKSSTNLTAEEQERANMFINKYESVHETSIWNAASIPVKDNAALLAAITAIGITSLFAASYFTFKAKRES